MSTTVRQQIINALAARLGTITTANGYATPINGKVTVWRKTDVAAVEAPCLEIRDQEATARLDESDLGSMAHDLQVEILIYVSGKTTADQARAAIGDVYAAIKSDYRLGGAGDCLCYPGGSSLDMEPYGDVIGAARVMLTITYYSSFWEA